MTDPKMPEIVFGGAGPAAAAGSTDAAGLAWPRPGALPPGLMMQIMRAAFAQLTEDPAARERYGDPRQGGTLVQSWRVAQLLGSPPPVCLLSAEQPRVTGAGVSRLVLVPVDELVRLVGTAQNYRARVGTQLFLFDGRTGHAVYSTAADLAGTVITYRDSWGDDSFLCREHNAAGVAARRAGDAWQVTADELTRVLVAAFISPAVWAKMTGQPGLSTLAELRASDLWSFFRLRETARDDSDPTYVPVTLESAVLAGDATMQLYCYENGEISSADLRLRRSWVLGDRVASKPSATDIAASWLATVVPAADRTRLGPLIGQLRSLRFDERLRANSQRPEWRATEAARLASAYLGLTDDSFTLAADLTFLTVETVTDADGTAWTSIRMSLG
jgi:hypothetical protein